MKIEIKNRFSLSIIFTHEIENNSTKLTIELAVAQKADLRGANLYGADLRGADLYGADLYGADLYGADLYGADLRGADLYGANLRGADLRGADLRGADLRGAKIADGVTIIKNPIFIYGLVWPITIYDQHMRIGCKFYAHKEWRNFTGSEIEMMDEDAPEFWTNHKTTLLALCDSHAKNLKDAA